MHTRECPRKTEVRVPQTKKLPEAWTGLSLAPSEGAQPRQHLDYGLLASGTVKLIHFCGLTHLIHGTSYRQSSQISTQGFGTERGHSSLKLFPVPMWATQSNVPSIQFHKMGLPWSLWTLIKVVSTGSRQVDVMATSRGNTLRQIQRYSSIYNKISQQWLACTFLTPEPSGRPKVIFDKQTCID